jgi:hypothetical protein
MKIGFAIASNQDSFLTQVLKSKHFHNTSFWTAPKHSSRTLFWASILKIMPMLEDNCSYQISQGNTIIWNNPWVQGWENIHSLLQETAPGSAIPNTISDLWLPDSKIWDFDKINTISDPSLAAQIQQLTISHRNNIDKHCTTCG